MTEPSNPSDPQPPSSSDSTPPPPPPPFTPPPSAAEPPPSPLRPGPAPSAPVYTPVPGAPAKKSAMPWILGGCGCLTLIILIVVIMGIIAYRAKKKVSEFQNDVKSRMQSVQDEQNRSLTSRSPGLEPEARIQTTAPKPGWKSYVNAKDNLPSALQSNFVAFSFDYPKSFELQPQSDVNFVKVEKYA